MAVAAMTIAWGGGAQRALRGICTGTAQGWTVGCVRVVHRSLATTSPGLCLQGCVAQGAPCKGVRRRAARKVRSGWSVRRQRRSAPCAWRAAVVLPRIRAQPRAEMMGGKLLGSAAQPGAGCGVRCTRSPATGAGATRGSRMRGMRERCGRRLRSSSVVQCGGGAWPWLWAAHPRDAMEERGCHVSSVNCLRLRRFFCTFYLTPRLP